MPVANLEVCPGAARVGHISDLEVVYVEVHSVRTKPFDSKLINVTNGQCGEGRPGQHGTSVCVDRIIRHRRVALAVPIDIGITQLDVMLVCARNSCCLQICQVARP